jgi:hypothetical protein
MIGTVIPKIIAWQLHIKYLIDTRLRRNACFFYNAQVACAVADLLLFKINTLELPKKLELEALHSFITLGIVAYNSYLSLLTSQIFVFR